MTFVRALLIVFVLLAAPVFAQSMTMGGRDVVAPRPSLDGPAPVISRLYLLNNDAFINPGDRLHVVLLGTPGALATFEVAHVGMAVMTEMKPGRYEGTLDVTDEMRAHDAPLTAHLSLGLRTTEATLDAPMTVGYGYPGQPQPVAAVPVPRLFMPAEVVAAGQYPTMATAAMFVDVGSPLAGQAVPAVFAVTGQTVPFARVDVELRATPRDAAFATVTGQADGQGWFSVPIRLPQPMVGQTVDVHILASDPTATAARAVDYTVATAP